MAVFSILGNLPKAGGRERGGKEQGREGEGEGGRGNKRGRGGGRKGE